MPIASSIATTELLPLVPATTITTASKRRPSRRMRSRIGSAEADGSAGGFNLDSVVERARAGHDAACWPGATTLRALACEEEQRRQRAAAWLDRVRSAVTPPLQAVVDANVSVHSVQPAEGSGQLPDLGSSQRVGAQALQHRQA